MLRVQLEIQTVYSTQGQAARGIHQISSAIGQICGKGREGCLGWRAGRQSEPAEAIRGGGQHARGPCSSLAPSHRPLQQATEMFPDAACTTAVYEGTREALGGIHLVENALCLNRHFDHLMQALKEAMHGNEHGNSMLHAGRQVHGRRYP